MMKQSPKTFWLARDMDLRVYMYDEEPKWDEEAEKFNPDDYACPSIGLTVRRILGITLRQGQKKRFKVVEVKEVHDESEVNEDEQ